MPLFNVKAPDGSIIPVNAPEGATEQQAIEFAAKTWKPSQPIDQPAIKEPTPYDKLSRAAGLTVRAVLEGAGDIAGIVGNPISAMTGLRRPSEIASDMATNIGLPEPKTRVERFSNIAGRGLTGAAGIVGAGRTLAKAPGLVGQFGELLAAQPAGQAAAAIGGAAGASVADEQGLTGYGALAPAVIGAMTAQGLMNTAKNLPVTMKNLGKKEFVVPPSQSKNPSITARSLETLSGKAKTEQLAASKNQALTNEGAAIDLGMAKDTKLNPEMLQSYRKQVYEDGYKPIAGQVKPSGKLQNELIGIAKPYAKVLKDFPETKAARDIVEAAKGTFDATNKPFLAENALTKIKDLRESARKAYTAGDTSIGKAYKDMSNALEDQLERHLASKGDPAAIKAFKEARKNIAKSHSIEDALVPSGNETFNVSAQKLYRQFAGGAPLSGAAVKIAKQAGATPKSMTLPVAGATNPYTLTDVGYGGAGMGIGATLAALTGAEPTLGALAGIAIPALRPVARNAVLSQPWQRAMQLPNETNRLANLIYPAMEVNQ